MNKCYWTIALALTSIAFSVGCSNIKNEQEKESYPNIPVVTVVQKDTILKTDYVSDIQAIKNVEIRARVQGFLENILVDEGQEVKKGQSLFKINDQELKTELARSKANVSNAMAETKSAELELNRTEVLVNKNIISKTEYELAAAKLKATKAKLDEAYSIQKNAETKLSYTIIKAPFDGIIDRIPLKIGSLIDPGALLTTISDIKQVYAYFHVSENEYLQYKKSVNKITHQRNPLQLILSDATEYPYLGKIETIDGEFNDNTGAIAFRAKFPNPNKLLKHGASGKVRITTDVEKAVLIPQKAGFEIQDKNYVFVVDKDNKIMMRPFFTTRRVAQFYIVDKGLKPGDKIVYEGIQNIKQGDKINPQLKNVDSIMRLEE
ncbi:MAG: efflux RND transporter periplasmic adaptor subunit [Sphingobacteriia bacterium]|nr:MAG: efflux RND transporter periplasmic adaptor subunit [Sphingobacteriia bacterium]